MQTQNIEMTSLIFNEKRLINEERFQLYAMPCVMRMRAFTSHFGSPPDCWPCPLASSCYCGLSVPPSTAYYISLLTFSVWVPADFLRQLTFPSHTDWLLREVWSTELWPLINNFIHSINLTPTLQDNGGTTFLPALISCRCSQLL